jgi:hypothetical protein
MASSGLASIPMVQSQGMLDRTPIFKFGQFPKKWGSHPMF